MIFFIVAGPGSASQTLKNRLLDTGFFFNKRHHMDLKSGKGLGHFKIRLSKIKLIYLKMCIFFNLNLLFYQHLFPSKENLNKLNYIFGIQNIIFILITRNIFNTAKHLKKLNILKKKLPLDGKKKIHFLKQTQYIIKFYSAWQKYFQKHPEKLNLITYNQIIHNKERPIKIFSKILKKKIILNKKIISNKHQKIKISLTPKEMKLINTEIKKHNKENLLRIMVL